MAISVPIITEFSDKGLKAAEAAFNNFKTKVAEADGAMGKMKAGFGAAGDFIKANAASMAAGAGASIAAFAVKGINAFNDLALSASKFADATGLAVEDASRYIEVAGDIGVEASTVESAFNRMNKAIAGNSEAFKDLGVQIEYTNEGTVDVNKTFIKTIDALKNVKDPAQRAALATQILGKSWTDMAELIQMGGDELKASLDSVSGAKVIDQDEVRKAKDYRANMDELGDSIDELAISLGENLVPALATAADYTAKLIKLVFGSETPKSGNIFLDLAVKTYAFSKSADDAGDKVERLDDALGRSRGALRAAKYEIERTSKATQTFDDDLNGLIDTWDEALSRFSQKAAFNDVRDAIDQVREATITAFEEKTPQAMRAAEEAVGSLYSEVGQYIQLLGDIPLEKQTEILALLDKGAYDEVARLLEQLSRDRTTTITVRTVGGRPVGPGETPTEARGGAGVTIVDPKTGQSHYLPPGIDFGALARGGGQRGVTNLSVNVAGSVTSERDLVETIRKGLVDAQRNGAQLVYSNT